MGELKIKAQLIVVEPELELSLAILLNKILTNFSTPNCKCLKRFAGMPENSKKKTNMSLDDSLRLAELGNKRVFHILVFKW